MTLRLQFEPKPAKLDRPTLGTVRVWLVVLCAAFAATGSPSSVNGQQTPGFEAAAELLQQATVTIRVEESAGDAATHDADAVGALDESDAEVTVFTGVCLGDRLVVAPMLVHPALTIRITMVDGEQSLAEPVAIDEFTGLALLRMDKDEIARLELADELPRVGSWVLSAAAWGIERPVISYGIVGGIDRRLAGTHYPPLLLCDLRTVDTSSGSPIVNPEGQLVGIVIAASTHTRRGWTYAIPVEHVDRIRRVLSREIAPDAGDSTATSSPVVVIQHRRPVVGMVLEDDGESIVVSHVAPGGPADQAGIRAGDRILGVDDVKIRSVYQAVIPTLHMQPGDVIRYRVVQQDSERDIAIVLGGDVTLPASSLAFLEDYIDPKLRIQDFSQLLSQVELPELQVGEALGAAAQGEPLSPFTPLSLLERAVANYQTVIAIQQEQLRLQEERRQQDARRIEELERIIQNLRDANRTDDSDDR